MKRFTLIFTGILGLAGIAHAGLFEQGSVTVSTDTRNVTISSNTAAATKILSRDSYVYSTQLTNNTSFFILLSTSPSTFNTATYYTLAPCTTTNCQSWSPDGPMVPYWGAMWAVQIGTSTTSTGNTISVFRTK